MKVLEVVVAVRERAWRAGRRRGVGTTKGLRLVTHRDKGRSPAIRYEKVVSTGLDEKKERRRKLSIVNIATICVPRRWILEGVMEASRIERAVTMVMAMMLLSLRKEAPSDVKRKGA